MLHARQDLTFGRTIALQFIGDDHAWHVLEPYAELTEEALRCFFVASALNQNIEYISILIHRSPQIVPLAIDFEKHLVHMPFVATTRVAATQCIGIGLPKLQTPLSNCFIGDDDPALCQQFLDIAKTEGETEIQPNGMGDNFRLEAKTFVVGCTSVCFHENILAYCSATLLSCQYPTGIL